MMADELSEVSMCACAALEEVDKHDIVADIQATPILPLFLANTDVFCRSSPSNEQITQEKIEWVWGRIPTLTSARLSSIWSSFST